ncbi:KAT8 regulatory NSL complex subunit 1-like protein [Cyprinus carpio]|uniref:KAT8 regulatory NSL complex subunit 1-like n=2 Tax=Cyprinus carpio TaxID=7962 RepID=A0A8C1Q0C7_CYPCA|nr:KAT8 regulatory NSL complex subunit 1-like protein [Cyprinus carpio]
MDCSGVALGLDVDNSFGQIIGQNLSSMVHLDLLSSKGSPQLPEMLLSPLFQDSHPKAFLLSSPEPPLLSLNRNSPDTPAGAPQMCFMPTLEDKGQDGVEPSQNLTPLQHGFSTRDCQTGTKSLSLEEASQCSRKNNALNQKLFRTMEELREGLMIQSLWHLSQHVSLANRASHLQQRVLAMLGEHASRHYSHQLDGLKKELFEARRSPKFPMTPECLFETFNVVEMQEAERVLIRNLQVHGQPPKSRDLQNLAHSGHAVLHGVLEALDSDATVSSSDEEWDHEGTSVESHCHVCEWRWLKDRAELCSCWTWLQMRLSDLDSQIQQLGQLRQQILSNKGHVILAVSQPLTDRQIQHTLWTETMDLSFTAGNMQDLHSDLEMEPSSPTRLLRNIERQSAQLTQIVNSLMPSLCTSPSSSPVPKGPCNRWRGRQKTAYSGGPQCFHKARQKRKRTCHRRQCLPQVDVTCTSARTRPLLTYHKPRLFVMDPLSHREQVLESSPSLCPKCASCDPASVCTDPSCLHRKDRTDCKMHPILSLSSDTLLSFHLQNSLFEESLLQRSLLLKTKRTSPDHCLSSRGRVSRSLFHCSHQPKNGWHLKSHRRESTPIRWARTQDQQSQVYREGKRRRRCSERPMDISSIKPKSDLVSQSDDSQVEESSEDVTVSYCTPTQQRNSEFSSRRRNFESIFSTDDIVIPMSLFASVKVERLKYKNILTPSWRKADIFPLTKREVDEQEEGMSEVLEDEDFFQRHQSYEH